MSEDEESKREMIQVMMQLSNICTATCCPTLSVTSRTSSFPVPLACRKSTCSSFFSQTLLLLRQLQVTCGLTCLENTAGSHQRITDHPPV